MRAVLVRKRRRKQKVMLRPAVFCLVKRRRWQHLWRRSDEPMACYTFHSLLGARPACRHEAEHEHICSCGLRKQATSWCRFF